MWVVIVLLDSIHTFVTGSIEIYRVLVRIVKKLW